MTSTLETNPSPAAVLPATVTWIGTDGDWYNAANWSTGKVPTQTDIVTIENKTKGETYEITFSQGQPNYNGLNLLASNGGIIKLSGLTSYQGSSQSDIRISATGVGSLIDLSDVTTLIGGKSLNILKINAIQGAKIDFSNLTKINGGTSEITADGAASIINLSKLTEFIDDDFDRSLLKTRNGGFIDLSKVTKLEEVDLNSDNSVLYLGNLTTYIGDNNVDALNGAQISLVKLNNVSGQILQVTVSGNKSRIAISEQLDESEYLVQENSGGKVIVSNNNSDLNYSPIVNLSIPAQTATQDQTFTFQVSSNTFVDFDPSDNLTYTATLINGSALPSWLTFNPTARTFSGTPTNTDVGKLDINVKATDTKGASVMTRLTLNITDVNALPVVSTEIPDQTTTAGQVFNFAVPEGTFTDVDPGDVLTYSVGALPSWLSFNPTARTFNGIPTNADAGTFNVTVTATDKAGTQVSDTFVLNVTATVGNNPPTKINDIAPQTATEGQLFTLVVPDNIFTDIDPGDVLTYDANLDQVAQPDLPLPAWLTFDPATKTFSGTPTNADVGNIFLNVFVTDQAEAQAFETFPLTVAQGPNNPPVVSVPIGPQLGVEEQLFTFQIPFGTFTDPDLGDSLTYSAANLPSWLSFDPATATFSGTPGNENVGTVTITAIATDSESASISTSFNIVVANVNDPPIVFTPIPDQSAIINRSFSFPIPSITFTDPDGEPLIYSATLENGDLLPSWLTFDDTAQTFTGIAPLEQYGTLNVSVSVTDPSGTSVSDSFAINIDIDAAQYGASHEDLIEEIGYDLPALSQHYRDFGRTEQRVIDQFDENRYVASNIDLAAVPEIVDQSTRLVNPDGAAKHYIESGYFEPRSLISFEPDQYIASYTDLIAAFGYDLTRGSIHYIQSGSQAPENRVADNFDEYRYLAGYDDLIAFYGADLVGVTQHYIVAGYSEDPPRDPLLFKPDLYIASYPDLIEFAAVLPFEYAEKLQAASLHYALIGSQEPGRVRNTGVFDPASYLTNNPDVAADPIYGSDPTRHYIELGYFEAGRQI